MGLSAEPLPSATAIPGGYPLDMVVSGVAVDSKFICALCKNLLKTPLQSFCGHRFCKGCVEAILQGSESVPCPSCLEEDAENEHSLLSMGQLFPDNAIKRDFIALHVKCPNAGCGWTGNLKTYEDHETKCQFKSEICGRCKQLVPVSGLQRHESRECPERRGTCEYCQAEMPVRNIEDHQKTDCMYVPVDCQYCKLDGIPRAQLRDHYETSCSQEMAMCNIDRCQTVVPKEAVGQHQVVDQVNHIRLINTSLKEVKVQLASLAEGASGGASTGRGQPDPHKEIERLEEIVHKLQKELDVMRTDHSQGAVGGFAPSTSSSTGSLSTDLDQKLRIQDSKITTFESIAAVLNSEILKCLNKIEDLSRRITDDSAAKIVLNNRVRELEESKRVQDEMIAKLQRDLEQSTGTCYDGQYIWKIDNVAKRRQDAISGHVTSIYSPPFFTGRTGYKMCARLYFNGDGMGRGSHVSLYFVIMKGNYDGLLRWPFRQKVTLMLLDQNRREHVVDAFRPDPSSSSFKMPVTEMNIASGCPLFCPLTTLDSMANKAYIKNDTLYIKIMVDTSDLL